MCPPLRSPVSEPNAIASPARHAPPGPSALWQPRGRRCLNILTRVHHVSRTPTYSLPSRNHTVSVKI
eukprot:4672348-Prymnesium_polylepis.1